ncbi:MAG: chromosomal replication initiator protein DnaA [Bacteroidales bacterium]|nr:chromosomal replication initiator protein DnaA [Bacteroidales bacterium]
MIQDKHIAVWNNCLSIIGNIVEPKQFDIWFKRIVPLKMENSTLMVEVPSDFFRDYLESEYLTVIKKTLKRVIGADAQLVYVTHPVTNQPALLSPAAQTLTPVNRPVPISGYEPSGNPGPLVFPGVQKKYQINPRLNTSYCFENFVEGACNRLGKATAAEIAANPGKTPFNPLFIFGGPGLGKTHLAQAIGLAIKDRDPEPVVLYVSGNEFKTQYMDATQKNRLAEFMAFYMKIDVLIVDDIQELQGKASQNAFFNIFNYLHQNGKQLILTSDRAPVDLENFELRLLSRFKWGIPVELSRPDYQTRYEMARVRSLREGIEMPADVLEYLASHIKSSFREIEGALMSLIAHATFLHSEITVELASKVVDNVVDNSTEELSINKICETVCEYFDITSEEMLARTRKRNIVQARQIAMFLCRNMLSNCSLATIGSEIGGKDHATVLHACTTVSDLMSTDKTFRKYVTDLRGILSPAENIA